ncbi:MAG: hypothetical protein ACYTX0_57875, partial [Nostoc sp.]
DLRNNSLKLLFLRVAPVATTGSQCGGRVPRHKGASRVGGSPDLSGLAPSGVGTPLRVPQFLIQDRTASPQRTGFSVPLW